MSSSPSRLLYAGYLRIGETSEMRCRALASLGYEVVPVELGLYRGSRGRLLISKVAIKLHRPIDWSQANREIRSRGPSCSIVWIEKGLTIETATFRSLRRASPNVRIIGYSPDDMTARWNTSRRFFDTLPLYDAFVTTKSYGVAELMALGAQRVVFSPNGYDPTCHRPTSDVTGGLPKRDIDVGFIGTFEEARARSIRTLCDAGVRVTVFGSGWERMPPPAPVGLTVEKPVLGAMYSQTLCRFRIALGFLRKINRDLQTTRSVEIPACGVFMLAERSQEHLDLFEEGVEAEYFGSDEELVAKVRHYLYASHARERIAAAGRERAIKGRYSYAWRLFDALQALGVSPPSPPAA